MHVKSGFFQVINNGIPTKLLEKILEGICRFHEQDFDAKRPFYTREECCLYFSKKKKENVLYNSNYYVYESEAAVWIDTITCKMAPLLSTSS